MSNNFENTNPIQQVQKRDQSLSAFDIQRIVNAIAKAMNAAQEGSQEEAVAMAEKVCSELIQIKHRFKTFIPTVEGIQNTIDKVLLQNGYVKTSSVYALYREHRNEARQKAAAISEQTKAIHHESKKYFRNTLSELIFLRTYARWRSLEGRRETWIETVERYMDFMRENLGSALTTKEYDEIRQAILKQEVMPSMRLMQFAGAAAKATAVCAYNCSYIAPHSLRDFAEVMYILMCGTGVGFSVESRNVQALPQIKFQTGEIKPTHTVEDSKEGWCEALILGLEAWTQGADIHFDFSKVRPAGMRLKTMGGRSSGPDPLRSLLAFVRAKILKRQGRRLTNINVHDILCKIGEVVIIGGIRRSAMLSLSDLDDQAMRDAKREYFYYTEPQRAIANNSAVYLEKPSNEIFLEEWLALIKSKTGERGIFNRGGLIKILPARRIMLWQKKKIIKEGHLTGMIGTNPCAEIILQSKQFCNLSEVVAREGDNKASLLRKIRIATILGTYQATLTHFPFLSKEWRENCESERLLGVSITGQWDCPAVRHPTILTQLKDYVIAVNRKYAKRFKINASTSVTCVKPSGTVSQTVDSASGMHPRYAKYYIRRVRFSASDPLFKMLKDQGVPYHPEVGQTLSNANTFVLEFPVKAPAKAVYKDDLSAIDQLEYWKLVKTHYTEHNPSVTISVGEEEWIGVANWLYQHWDIIGGLSFLPRFQQAYPLAPFEAIDRREYEKRFKKLKNIDFSQLPFYEQTDETEMKARLACESDRCEDT